MSHDDSSHQSAQSDYGKPRDHRGTDPDNTVPQRKTDRPSIALDRGSIDALGDSIRETLSRGAVGHRWPTDAPSAHQPIRHSRSSTSVNSIRVGRNNRSPLSPRLAYGRHRGPARRRSRHAAVLIIVYPHHASGELCLTLTRRPTSLSHHGGQICLPGGRVEAGESSAEAALREYHEELGVRAEVRAHLGQLEPMYVFASDNLVETVIVTAETPDGPWQPDPVEVDEVIELPVAQLLSLGMMNRKKSRRGKVMHTGEVFHYEFGYRAMEFVDCSGSRREIWGATAMLLDEFAGVLCRATG